MYQSGATPKQVLHGGGPEKNLYAHAFVHIDVYSEYVKK